VSEVKAAQARFMQTGLRWRINELRWRLARVIAPSPIVAAPRGDEGAFLYLREGRTAAWIAAASLDLNVESGLSPIGDEFGRVTMGGNHYGTFSGTVA
jgi:hypothetical protein